MVSVKKYFNVETKSADDGVFSGTLSTYGNVDFVGDVCEKGCFDKSIQEKGTHFPCLFNHNDNEPIGSFDVIETEMELRIKGKFNQGVQRGREVHSLMKERDITGLSIGYVPKKFYFDQDGIRHLTEVELFEGSVVAFPANPLATAEAKKMNENFVVFRKSLIQTLKLSGKSDDEINKIVDETEKRCKECEECEEQKAEEPKVGEESTDAPKEESQESKEENEPPKEEGLSPEEIAQLKQLCADLKEEQERLKEEMKA